MFKSFENEINSNLAQTLPLFYGNCVLKEPFVLERKNAMRKKALPAKVQKTPIKLEYFVVRSGYLW